MAMSERKSSNPVTGQAARRKFLRTSGAAAVAAPAAVLLLSATSRSVSAQTAPYTISTDTSTVPR
jgi:hypothetical protein